MITDLKNIILDYAISEMDGLSPTRIKKSFQQMSKELDVYIIGQSEQLGRIEHFTIKSVRHNDGYLVIDTESPIKKTHRIPLNSATTKQVYNTLLNMHGLTGIIKVTNIEATGKPVNKYTRTVIKDIETINRDEFTLPAEKFGIKVHYSSNKMIKMRETLFKKSKIDKIRAEVFDAI